MTIGNSTERGIAWADFVRLAESGRNTPRLLRWLMDELVTASRLESAAIYRSVKNGYRRSVAAGPTTFPEIHEDLDLSGVGHYPVPGGKLLFRPVDAEAAIDHRVLLALICALDAAELTGRLKRESFAVNLGRVELQSLYDVGLAIAGTLDLETLGDEVLLRAISLLDARVGAFYLLEDGSYRLHRTFGGKARSLVADDDPELAALLRGEREGAPLLPGTQYAFGVPIEADGRKLGLLAVADKESRTGIGPFEARDVQTLRLFANQAAIAIENARLHRQALEQERLERELDLAADIQRRLLPTELPEVAGFEFCGWSRPARHVGGDFYDLALAEDGSVQLALADVAGKGMPAALLVSTLHSALRLLLDARAFDAKLVERLNRHVAESSASNKFITMTAARLEPASGGLSYVNAGHNPPLLVRAAGDVEELPSGGMPLGIFGGAKFRAERVELAEGDLLCIFSDGITECENAEGEEFGAERLAELLRELSIEPLTEVMAAIDAAVTEFAAGAAQGDDQTVVLLRRSP